MATFDAQLGFDPSEMATAVALATNVNEETIHLGRAIDDRMLQPGVEHGIGIRCHVLAT